MTLTERLILLHQRWIDNPLSLSLARSIRDEPELWSINGNRPMHQVFTLEHVSGVDIWVANGWWFCAVNRPHEIKLGLIGRTRVWLACRPYVEMGKWEIAERMRRYSAQVKAGIKAGQQRRDDER